MLSDSTMKGSLLAILLLSAVCLGQQTSRFAPAVPDWSVGESKPVSLLLAFDTDTSLNRMGYRKFYDCNVGEFFPQYQCRYQTVMWTRSGDSVRLAVSLPIVACPTKRGFLYAGFAGFSKPPDAATVKNPHYPDFVPEFVDCGDVWQTHDPTQIKQSIADLKRKLAAGRCGEAAKGNSNRTEDWRISFITPKALALEGFEAEITGDAAYFNATEYDREYSLDTESDMGLADVLPQTTINRAFWREFRQRELKPSWGGDGPLNEYDFAEYAGFTFIDAGSAIRLIGLHFAAGNAERTFLATVDLGVAPASLVNYADFGLDFAQFKKIDPKTLVVFSSPDKATIFVLTMDRMIAIDTKSRRELFNAEHGLEFNKIIMAEWAEGANTTRWETQLNAVAAQGHRHSVAGSEAPRWCLVALGIRLFACDMVFHDG